MMERTDQEAKLLRAIYEDNFVRTLLEPYGGADVTITEYGIARIELETVLDNHGYIH